MTNQYILSANLSSLDLFINIIVPICALLFAYLLGSISISVILGKLYFHQDPRQYGSKNPGGTNSGRLWGKKIGVLVMISDMIKASLGFWITYIVIKYTQLDSILVHDSQMVTLWITPLGSVLGHCYSCFLKFKGGKGVSTMVGSLGSSSLLQLGFGVFSFFIPLLSKKYVSLSSICLSIGSIIISWSIYITSLFGDKSIANSLLMPNGMLEVHIIYPLVCTTISLIVILRHKANIKRLLNHTETQVGFLVKK
ncbi:MAG: glycerol-3-phosphate 1-O-acyltransferase PlsY [Bacilli bacterium]